MALPDIVNAFLGNLPPPSMQMGAPQFADQAPLQPQTPTPRGLRSGILGGTFGVGHTGGNILGLLGDALLVGSGHAPMYQPRLEAERAGQALQGFGTDPMAAVERYAHVDPQSAAALGLKVLDQQNDNADKAYRERYYNDLHKDSVINRNIAYLGAANPNTYPMIKAQVEKSFADEGIDFPALPDKWDPEGIRGTMVGSMKPKDQFGLYNQQQNQDYKNRVLAERTGFHQQEIAQGGARVVEANRHNTTTEGIQTANSNESGRHNRVTEAQGQQRNDMNPNNPANKSKTVTLKGGEADGMTGTVNSSGDRMVVTRKDGSRQLFVKSGMTKDGRRIWTPIQ